MLKYQIHKLTKGGSESRSVFVEDILTSDVFGLMTYFPYDLMLKPFLDQIRIKNNNPYLLVPEAEPVEVSFWKNYSWPNDLPYLERESIEPDVVIEWNDLLLMVEAKFISPADPEELLREFLICQTESHSEKKAFLLLIDKNLSPPSINHTEFSHKISISQYIENRIKKLNISNNYPLEQVSSSVLWINWQSFYLLIEKLLHVPVLHEEQAINCYSKRVLGDLILILKRKGLIPFNVLSLDDFMEYEIDTNSLGQLGLMMRGLFSNLTDVSVDIHALEKIGLIVNDPLAFLLDYGLHRDMLMSLLPDNNKLPITDRR